MTNKKTQKELIKELKSKIKELAGHQKILKVELSEQSREYNRLRESNPSWRPYSEIFKKTVGFKHSPTLKRQQSKLNIRCYLLAYGFLRGLPYKAMENKTKGDPDWILKNRATNVYAVYSEYFSDDSRIQKLSENDILHAFRWGNHGD